MSELVVPDPPELAALQAETRALQATKENEQLRADIKALKKPPVPWWQNAAAITSLTAIVAATVPVTTGVQGCIQKSRELSLEAKKNERADALERAKHQDAVEAQNRVQTESVRTTYLNLLRTPGEHRRMLRFIVATAKDDDLRKWAIAEQDTLQADIGRFQTEAEQKEKIVEAALLAYEAALKSRDVDQRRLEHLKNKVINAAKDLDEARKFVRDYAVVPDDSPLRRGILPLDDHHGKV